MRKVTYPIRDLGDVSKDEKILVPLASTLDEVFSMFEDPDALISFVNRYVLLEVGYILRQRHQSDPPVPPIQEIRFVWKESRLTCQILFDEADED